MNYKMTSQYKWFHNRFRFHLFCACVWLVIIFLIFLLIIADTEVNLKDFALYFLIYGCVIVIIFCGTIITYYGIKLINISKDNYQIKEAKIVNIYEISARKIELTILTETNENKEIIIYKVFFDPAISLKKDEKIKVLVGKSNTLI